MNVPDKVRDVKNSKITMDVILIKDSTPKNAEKISRHIEEKWSFSIATRFEDITWIIDSRPIARAKSLSVSVASMYFVEKNILSQAAGLDAIERLRGKTKRKTYFKVWKEKYSFVVSEEM